jgi:hypothetical protein
MKSTLRLTVSPEIFIFRSICVWEGVGNLSITITVDD